MTATPDYAAVLRLMAYLIAETQARSGWWADPHEVADLACKRDPSVMRGISHREAAALAYIAHCGYDIGTGLVAEVLVAWYDAELLTEARMVDARARHPEMTDNDWADVMDQAAEYQERGA